VPWCQYGGHHEWYVTHPGADPDRFHKRETLNITTDDAGLVRTIITAEVYETAEGMTPSVELHGADAVYDWEQVEYVIAAMRAAADLAFGDRSDPADVRAAEVAVLDAAAAVANGRASQNAVIDAHEALQLARADAGTIEAPPLSEIQMTPLTEVQTGTASTGTAFPCTFCGQRLTGADMVDHLNDHRERDEADAELEAALAEVVQRAERPADVNRLVSAAVRLRKAHLARRAEVDRTLAELDAAMPGQLDLWDGPRLDRLAAMIRDSEGDSEATR